MPTFPRLLAIALSLAATTTASTCPQNWLPDTSLDDDSKCCYGNMLTEGRISYCCVYDMTPTADTSSVSMHNSTSSFTADNCVTKIPFSASDYSDQVSSASSKIAAATTTIATNSATSTTNSVTSMTNSVASTSSTTNAAMPIATAQEIVLGGAAVIVGLFVL